jgi:hypothetical protein
MVNKIIGFTISKNDINHDDIDVFQVNLKQIKFKHAGLNIYLWGIQDFELCRINNSYSLSFPLSNNLLDRNLLITLDDNLVIIENDWLGSIPVFYNEKNLIVSTLSLKTLTDPEIYHEGFINYIQFGYSVLENTPFLCTKFLRYYSKLIISSKEMNVFYKHDPICMEGVFDKTTNEGEVFLKIHSYISEIEDRTSDEIIIPSSGGYDSRLLNLCINDKNRIRAFTYGISDDQSKSSEVVFAKRITDILNINWSQIELGKYNNYIDDWFKIFGFSTHLHGMYHIEFYKKILESHSFRKDATFLSGIIGDAWAGNVIIDPISNINELINLGHSHGIHGDISELLIKSNNINLNNYLIKNVTLLINPKIRIISSMRMKILLLSYLTIIPEYFGFPVWTPFLNFKIAIGMLNLPKDRRDQRVWQKEIFKKNGLDVESLGLKPDFSNTQDYHAFYKHEFEPLDIDILHNYFRKDYLIKVNTLMEHKDKKIMQDSLRLKIFIKLPFIERILIKYDITKEANKDILIAVPYYILKPIEKSIKFLKNLH